MTTRPAALILLGVWLGALLASWVAASVNFRTVDRVLGPQLRPELERGLAPVPAPERRAALRHLASEINRWMFRWWSSAQAVLGLLLLALVWPQRGPRWLAGAALLIVLVQLGLTGPIVGLGRSLDFLPRPLPAELARRFRLLHTGYVALDLAKAAALAGATVLAARRAR